MTFRPGPLEKPLGVSIRRRGFIVSVVHKSERALRCVTRQTAERPAPPAVTPSCLVRLTAQTAKSPQLQVLREPIKQAISFLLAANGPETGRARERGRSCGIWKMMEWETLRGERGCERSHEVRWHHSCPETGSTLQGFSYDWNNESFNTRGSEADKAAHTGLRCVCSRF